MFVDLATVTGDVPGLWAAFDDFEIGSFSQDVAGKCTTAPFLTIKAMAQSRHLWVSFVAILYFS